MSPSPNKAIVSAPSALPWAGTADPASRYLAKLAKGSVPTQRSALRRVASLLNTTPERFPWHAMTVSSAEAIAARIRETYAAATAARMLAAVRGALAVCRSERWFVLTPEPSGYVPSQLEHFRSLAEVLTAKQEKGRKHGRVVTDEELASLYFASSPRTAAILALGFGAGLRREEIASLKRENVHSDGRIDVVLGKGSKNRTTFIGPTALLVVNRLVDPYIDAEDAPVIGLGAHAIWAAVVACQKDAGVAKFTPHDMRRTCATRLLRDGVPLQTVQSMLGHESSKTTERYDLSSIDDIARHVRRVDIPFGDVAPRAESRCPACGQTLPKETP